MTRERPIRSFLPAATALWLLVALPAFAQEGPLPDLFSDVIDVRVVNVEVVVTDRKGDRIQGLEPGDFELLVDGTPTPISYFTEVDDGLARAPSDDAVGSVPALAPEEPVGTNYLIFVDDLFAIAQRRNRVLDHLAQDLGRLGPADRVAVVAFDGRELDRLTDWTNSRDEIEDALVRARERKALGLENKFGLGLHTRRSVMAAAGTLRSFADAPGRKVMLLLADGWDTLIDLWNPRSLWVTRFQGDICPTCTRPSSTPRTWSATASTRSMSPGPVPGARTASVPFVDRILFETDQGRGRPGKTPSWRTSRASARGLAANRTRRSTPSRAHRRGSPRRSGGGTTSSSTLPTRRVDCR
ncbi:MAG: VWA domain-containing protein [Acidobacteria bacterium]|nr:VWA domain-containing protein [Acidobacteriota bacterium]